MPVMELVKWGCILFLLFVAFVLLFNVWAKEYVDEIVLMALGSEKPAHD